MILEFRVENFLSFRDEQMISFEPSADKEFGSLYCAEVREGVKVLKLGILYGANASGKTNLLRAFDFLRKFVLEQKKDKTETTGIIKFQFDNENLLKPVKFQLSFYLNQVKYVYQMVLDDKIVLNESLIYYPGTQPALVFDRKFNEEKQKTTIKFGGTVDLKLADRKLIEGLTISNSSVFSAFARANVEKTVLDEVFNWFKESFMPMVLPTTNLIDLANSKVQNDDNFRNFVLEVLQKADFNISSIDIDNPETDSELESKITGLGIAETLKKESSKTIYGKTGDISFQHKTPLIEKNIPMRLESNGTLRYYGLGAILSKLLWSNTFLCVDEIENSLHNDLVAHFIKTFLINSSKSQLLFSTHDMNLLNQDFLRRDTVWFVDKNEFGASEVDSLLDFKLHKNLSPFNAYRIGKLGAKPELGEIILKQHG